MGHDFATRLLSDVMWNTMLVCAPIVLLTLVAGVVVSILQAVTQVQDVTLSFVPKIIVAGVALLFFGQWMLRRVLWFASNAWASIPSLFGG
jgi:flagellar biosynthesis protein FliQ